MSYPQYLLGGSCVITSLILLRFFVVARYLFVKPSIVFSVCFHLLVQWPTFFYYQDIANHLTATLLDLILILSLFPPVTAVVSGFIFRPSAKAVFENLPAFRCPDDRSWVLLALGAMMCGIIYFAFVPPTATGLFSIMTGNDSESNTIAREESMKLLPAVARYSFVAGTVFSNMLAVLAGYQIYVIYKRSQFAGQLHRVGLYAGTIVFAAVFGGASGARLPMAITLLCIFALFFLLAKLRASIVQLLVATLLFLAIPTCLQYMRSDNKEIGVTLVTIFDRLCYVRIMSGVSNVEYAEMFGNFGIAAIPKLALVFGVEPVNAANEVCLYVYGDRIVDSGLANCSFVFSYYAYFGLVSLPLCMGLVWLLDLSLYFVRKAVVPELQALAIIGVLIPMISLTSTDYSVIFLTKGLVLWPVVCAAIGLYQRTDSGIPHACG